MKCKLGLCQAIIRITEIQSLVTTPNAGEDAEKLDLSYVDGVNANGIVILEYNLAVSLKTIMCLS